MRAVRRAAVLIAISAMTVSSCSPGSSGKPAAATTTATVRIVNQNLLHGTACPPDTNRCDLPHRVALFLRQLERAKCPEIVAIEEGNRQTVTELRKGLPGSCSYQLVYDDDPGQDREIVLTSKRVLASERNRLAGPLRTAYWVRIATAAGPVDLVATHLASGSDNRPCDRATCSPPCLVADTLNACQGRQAAALLRKVRTSHSIAVLAGDLNAKPNEPTISDLVSAGLVDTHRAIGNAECKPATGAQCTSGRIDDSLVDMRNLASHQNERIDYVLVAPVARCRVVRPTGIFASRGGPTSDLLNGIVFPADHSAVIATISCQTTSSDLAAARTVVSTTTTRPAKSTQVSEATKTAVTAAFTNLFAPNPDPDAQLSTVENAAALRESFIARKQQVGDLATKTSVRVESFTGATASTVDVTFSILLDGNVVLDHLRGQAKLVDGRWVVATSTYCQVATLGTDTVPEVCHP